MSYLKQMNMKSYYYLSLMLCALSAGVSAQEITKEYGCRERTDAQCGQYYNTRQAAGQSLPISS